MFTKRFTICNSYIVITIFVYKSKCRTTLCHTNKRTENESESETTHSPATLVISLATMAWMRESVITWFLPIRLYHSSNMAMHAPWREHIVRNSISARMLSANPGIAETYRTVCIADIHTTPVQHILHVLPLRKFMNEKGVDYLVIAHSRELTYISRE